jgi:hypothetical protein
MKKAKIMLAAIVTFTVVGGALAFKTKGFSLTTIYTSSSPVVGQSCPNATTPAKPFRVVSSGGTAITATTIAGSNCANILTAVE